MKICSGCRDLKILGDFGRNERSTDGRKSRCKRCCADDQRVYASAHPEQIEAYREANRDRLNADRRDYYAEHADAERAAARARIAADPELYRQRAQAYRDADPQRAQAVKVRSYQRHAVRIRAEKRRARDLVRVAVYAWYGDWCACCGETSFLSIDHINGDGAEHRQEVVGNRRGGGENFHRWLIRHGFPVGYQTLCMPCNSSKGRGAQCILAHNSCDVPELITT